VSFFTKEEEEVEDGKDRTNNLLSRMKSILLQLLLLREGISQAVHNARAEEEEDPIVIVGVVGVVIMVGIMVQSFIAKISSKNAIL
jgi:hypothetical protein